MKKTKAKKFVAAQFGPTQHDGAEQKAKFANHFVRFAEGGFQWTIFPDWFYKRLSMTFGHIAEYDRSGFYGVKFSTRYRQMKFMQRIADWKSYGDPAFTYSDVEFALKNWIVGSGLIEVAKADVAAAQESDERELLAKLKAKYEPKQEAA